MTFLRTEPGEGDELCFFRRLNIAASAAWGLNNWRCWLNNFHQTNLIELRQDFGVRRLDAAFVFRDVDLGEEEREKSGVEPPHSKVLTLPQQHHTYLRPLC